jgi:hypothetical protein
VIDRSDLGAIGNRAAPREPGRRRKMKKLLLLSVLLGVLFVSASASAFYVEARGFSLCTNTDPGTQTCLAGTFFGRNSASHPEGTLQNVTSPLSPPDWPLSIAQRWEPIGTFGFLNATGVNWTCCMDYNSSTDDLSTFSTTFEYWDVVNNVWVPAAWKGFIGMDDTITPDAAKKWCWDTIDDPVTGDGPDYIYQGKKDTGGPGNAGPWNYGTSPDNRVARCSGTMKSNGQMVTQGFEYWMD